MPKRKATKPKTLDDLPAGKLVDGASRGRRNAGRSKDGIPNEVHQDWYRQWTRFHKSFQEIADGAGVNRSSVHQAVHAVRLWIAAECHEDTVADRQRQSATLEVMVTECLVKWRETWDTAYVNSAAKLLEDYRKMYGIDKPIRIEMTDAESLLPIEGIGRREAVRRQLEARLAELTVETAADK